MDPRSAKSHLRLSIAERMKRERPQDRTAESRTLCKEAVKLLPSAASDICAFSPLPDEADVTPLLAAILERGHRLFLPLFDGKKMAFHRVETLDGLAKGPLGILEPSADADELEPAALSLAFIPGRGFTRDGARIGRGNGGYDIWMKAVRAVNPAARMIGVALESQLTNDVPWEAHDEKVDAVVTARGVM
jgi:5-formyltetrahydrofolate cyclo-ligase